MSRLIINTEVLQTAELTVRMLSDDLDWRQHADATACGSWRVAAAIGEASTWLDHAVANAALDLASRADALQQMAVSFEGRDGQLASQAREGA